MSPSFSVLCCRLSAKIATIILPNHVCHLRILHLPLVGFLHVILPSVISCKRPSCLKRWSIFRCFLFKTEFSICLSSFTLLRTSLLVTADLFHSSPYPHFKGFKPFVCPSQQCCIQCYTPDQVFHSRFILPVNNVFFCINTFFAISILHYPLHIKFEPIIVIFSTQYPENRSF